MSEFRAGSTKHRHISSSLCKNQKCETNVVEKKTVPPPVTPSMITVKATLLRFNGIPLAWKELRFILLDEALDRPDEVPRNETKKEIDNQFLKKLSSISLNLCEMLLQVTPGLNRVRVKKKDILPISGKDLTNTPREKDLGFMKFLSSTFYSVFDISPQFHCALLIASPSMVRYRAQILTSQFVFKMETKSLLSLGEAFTEFFQQITETTMIFFCYALILWLVVPLHPMMQLFIMLMLIAGPCYYVPELVGMASGITVPCGSFEMPLFWFIASGAFLLSLLFVFLSLLVIYIIRRYIHPRGESVREADVGLDDLRNIFEEFKYLNEVMNG
ncbi:unnamed protein product [Sphenostylis stenocarpa]|uniref:Uncharacterized protein n=1 Tax=Sphenostylis stenocarpa TaxID=92480 RepID=A0AA86V974_9FABA|nr:unnamed protein product [Sphenostylis stenocarpa]